MAYSIAVQRVAPRALASVHERMAIRDVPARFRPLLDQVYAAAKQHAIALDGQNVFVYRTGTAPLADVEFGVGVAGPFAPVGRVTCSQVPAGEVATTTHWGDYAALGAAHDAVVGWCRANGHVLAGVAWEGFKARDEARRAEQEARRAQTEAQHAANEVKRERAVKDFLIGLFKASDPAIAPRYVVATSRSMRRTCTRTSSPANASFSGFVCSSGCTVSRSITVISDLGRRAGTRTRHHD